MPKAVAAKSDYNAEDIDWFQGLEAVRKRPTMYIGTIDEDGLVHLSKEIIANANDEAMNGHGKLVQIFLGTDGAITVVDQGRGIPVGPHPKHKGMDAMTLVATELHAGGKMKANAYNASGGVHGVGLAAVNALSSVLELWSYRNACWDYQQFKAGQAITKVIKKDPPKMTGIEIAKQGTIVRWKADMSIFQKTAKFSARKMIEWIDTVAWLLPVKYVIVDEKSGKARTIHRPNGLKDRFAHECNTLGVEAIGEPFIYQDEFCDVLIGWVGSAEKMTSSYVSYIRTVNHGVHVDGMVNAIFNTFSYLCAKDDVFTKDALQSGMVALINVKVHGAEFTSQDKVKLSGATDMDVKNEVYTRLYGDDVADTSGAFYDWLKKNKEVRQTIIDRSNEFVRLHEQFKASANLASKLKTTKKGKVDLPETLKVSITKKADERELFIVEGDSAKGTAGNARNAQFQEVLPLSGKIPNSWKGNIETVFDNFRVIDMLKAIGFDPKNPGVYRVGKVMLLMDADDDGYHISALVLGFLWKVCPDLFKQNRIYLVNAPLFSYQQKDGVKVYADTMPEMIKKAGKGFDVQRVTRMKGWGEASPATLKETAFNAATRSLTKPIEVKTDAELELIIAMLGEDVAARKLMLGL